MINYKNKYLKYKIKYEKIIKQTGGGKCQKCHLIGFSSASCPIGIESNLDEWAHTKSRKEHLQKLREKILENHNIIEFNDEYKQWIRDYLLPDVDIFLEDGIDIEELELLKRSTSIVGFSDLLVVPQNTTTIKKLPVQLEKENNSVVGMCLIPIKSRKKVELSQSQIELRDRYVNEWIDKEFPHIIISIDEGIEDFIRLKKKIEDKDCSFNLSYIGNKSSGTFFNQFRSEVKLKKYSFISAWENLVERRKIIEGAYSINRVLLDKGNKKMDAKIIHSSLRARYGTVNQFKPNIASCLYKTYNARHVVDFSAGWGDRCVAAMACGIKYTGIDTNTNLIESYNQMKATYIPYSNSNEDDINIIFQDSAQFNFTDLEYDMIFTSPPYFTLEAYPNQPDYSGYEGWFENFLLPVITNSVKNLDDDGYICLNVPHMNIDEYGNTIGGIYGSVVSILGIECSDKIELPIKTMNRSYNINKTVDFNKNPKFNNALNNKKCKPPEYSEYFDVELNECQELCLKDLNCNSISYNKNDRLCNQYTNCKKNNKNNEYVTYNKKYVEYIFVWKKSDLWKENIDYYTKWKK